MPIDELKWNAKYAEIFQRRQTRRTDQNFWE